MTDLETINVAKDLGDWILYYLSLGAAATAIVLFVPWALERRRRPEVHVLWQFSRTGQLEDLEEWPVGTRHEIAPGDEVLISVSILNSGDRAGEDMLTNFVVPDLFSLAFDDDLTAKPAVARNMTAGLPPQFLTKYFGPAPTMWTPGNWWYSNYRLKVSADLELTDPRDARLLFALSDPRFNRTGRRWLPSMVGELEIPTATAGQPWPPVRRRSGLWKGIRWITAQPASHVLCSVGERQDTRDLRVTISLQKPAAEE